MYNKQDLEIAKEINAELNKRSKIVRDFIKTNEFKDLISIIKKEDYVSQYDLKYQHQKIDGLSKNQFKQVCDTVFKNLEDQIFQHKNEIAPVCYIEYEGIEFSLLISQGSNYSAKRL